MPEQLSPSQYHDYRFERPNAKELFRHHERPARESDKYRQEDGIYDKAQFNEDIRKREETLEGLEARDGLSARDAQEVRENVQTIVNEAYAENDAFDNMSDEELRERAEQGAFDRYQELRNELEHKQSVLFARENAQRAAEGQPLLKGDTEVSEVVARAMNRGELPKVALMQGRDGIAQVIIFSGEVSASYRNEEGRPRSIFYARRGREGATTIGVDSEVQFRKEQPGEPSGFETETLLFPTSKDRIEGLDLITGVNKFQKALITDEPGS